MRNREKFFLALGIVLFAVLSSYFAWGTALASGPSVAEYEQQKPQMCDRLEENIGTTYRTIEDSERNNRSVFDFDFDLNFSRLNQPISAGDQSGGQRKIATHTITKHDVEECRNTSYEEWVEVQRSSLLSAPFPLVEGSLLTAVSILGLGMFTAALTGWRR